MYDLHIREEELKKKVAVDWFGTFDTTKNIGSVDFCVAIPQVGFLETESLLWAESKAGNKEDIYESFVQLILTIGKERTIDHNLPPSYLGAFDAEKIAFLPYNEVMWVFSQNDFNWKVTPSNHSTKEFRQLYDLVKDTIEANAYLYNYDEHTKELRAFIHDNFKLNKENPTTILINKNNFTHIYLKWFKEVKPTISINWEVAKKEGLIDADFYLADILSANNATITDKLFVLLRNDRYKYNIRRKASGSLSFEEVDFNDKQKAHNRFWKRYTRPPKEEYWDYIVNRRDLLVPQDIRERKGSFFTPSRWVELSQEYIARELGENWQDEYYVWDCAAGTGNLLAGLINKYNIYASTLDMPDVDVMHELINSKALHLLPEHVFQFDFLNDSFDKLPQSLKDIINDPEERKKLVIYINPPYAEATTATTVTGTGTNKSGVAINNATNTKYKGEIKNASNELFALFLIRIYHEIPSCVLAEFSKLKILQATNFRDFRKVFRAKLGRLFIVPANTFDNVKGQFPIGFHIWRTEEKEVFEQITADVYDKNGVLIGKKNLYNPKERQSINQWWVKFKSGGNTIGLISNYPPDFQNQGKVCLLSKEMARYCINVTLENIIPCTVYFAVRHCIEATWLNDRDQFLYPNDTWKEDLEFQSDCLTFTLFHGQNRISISQGTNHWIPFTEEEVGARDRFASHFMTDYIRGKMNRATAANLFNNDAEPARMQPITFSPEATAVMNAGREVWRYYHKQENANPNAAFYDIRLYFQGTDSKGKMNADSQDEQYMSLIKQLRSCLKILAKKIEPKVYEHGFLMK